MSLNRMSSTHDHRLIPVPSVGHDAGLLITRLLLGSILVAHGWQKVHTWTLSGTSATFDKMGVPAHSLSALFAVVAELGGGLLLIAGLATQLAGLLVVVDMLGAFLFVHHGHGVFAAGGGWELVGALGISAFLLTLVGPGRFSLDSLLTRNRRRRAVGADDHQRPVVV